MPQLGVGFYAQGERPRGFSLRPHSGGPGIFTILYSIAGHRSRVDQFRSITPACPRHAGITFNFRSSDGRISTKEAAGHDQNGTIEPVNPIRLVAIDIDGTL